MTDNLTRTERIDRAHRMVSDLCTRKRDWMMSIPARPDYDPDFVIGDGLLAGREAEAEALRLREALIAIVAISGDRERFVLMGPRGWAEAERIAIAALKEKP